MKRNIPLILDTLAFTALAVWLGGLAVCWAALVPAVHAAGGEPAASDIFVETLRRLSAIIESCGIILAALQWVLRRRYQRIRNLFVADGVRMLILFFALFFAEYGRYVLIPALLRTHSFAAYATLEGLALGQAVLLVVYAAITVWLQLPQPAVPARAVVTPAAPARAVPARPLKGKR